MAENINIQLGYKDSAWFSANSSLVLLDGQIVFLEQTGTYKIGDGVTQLSSLSFLGNGDTSNLVPYTGATQDVDIGNNQLNSKSFKVNGTNGSGKLVLKHQSTDATATGQETVIFAGSDGELRYKNDGNAVQQLASRAWVAAQGFITNIITALGYTPENASNKSSSYTASSTNTYANTKALVDGLDTKKTFLKLGFASTNAAANTTYYFGLIDIILMSAGLNTRNFQIKTGTKVTGFSISLHCNASPSSSTTNTVYLRDVTNSTDYLLLTHTAILTTGVENFFSGTSLNISINNSNTYVIKYVTGNINVSYNALIGSAFLIIS